MALTKNDLAKIQDATAALDAAYADYFARSDGYCKSSEGMISISGGTFFQRRDEDQIEELRIEVYSYVFSASGRRSSFTGVDAASQFLDWAKVVLAEQLANEYDQYGDLIHRDAEGNLIDKWEGFDHE